MDKVYNFKDFENKIDELWQSQGVFKPKEASEGLSEGKPFVVVIPPPNVTGVLHMGHGLNNNIQDGLVRYHRMKGQNTGNATLWIPGSDHAGIATQQIMERRLAAEGLSKQDLGREKFIERTWQLSHEHKKIIVEQLHKMGASFDWSRERFTLDDGLSKAVREVFVQLYEKDLIYRADYLINWSVDAGTALSDDEVVYKEVQAKLYHVRYPLANDAGADTKNAGAKDEGLIDGITVATTRPETMFGDTAVAVNPQDARYTHLVGKEIILPLSGARIKIIADEYVDMEFGSGAVKITPAHDTNDYEMGKRHNLINLNILNLDGTLNENVPSKYQGQKVKEARKAVVKDLEEGGYLVKVEEHTHKVGHCYRTACVVEPIISRQWFVRMKGMAQNALRAYEEGKIKFYPKHWGNTYTHWLENIRDWCISRQLWWGHRMPVWYNDETGEIIVSRDDPTQNPKYEGVRLRQEEDVLDTWFSSWLWPFSVFGWPEQTEDLKKFYPISTLVTAYDIIFFWVARMIMAGIEFTGEVPFRDVYMHGLVRDDKGRKMSKSLGNGIDPLKIIEQYGADALKFTLTFMCKLGGDVLLNEDHFLLGSKFANKVWNASRYVLLNLEECHYVGLEDLRLRDLDVWMFGRMQQCIESVDEAMSQYRLDDAAKAVYEYFWTDFCDWYVEASKVSLYSVREDAAQCPKPSDQPISRTDGQSASQTEKQPDGIVLHENLEKIRASKVLLWFLVENLKILHPFLPFITEEIYQYILSSNPKNTEDMGAVLAGVAYPMSSPASKSNIDVTARTSHSERTQIEPLFVTMQEIITGIRTLRSEFNISPKLKIRIRIFVEPQATELRDFFERHSDIIKFLINAESLEFLSEQVANTDEGIGVSGTQCLALVDIKNLIDISKEISRLQKKIEKFAVQLGSVSDRLKNKKFIDNAKAEYIQEIRAQEEEYQAKIAQLESFLEKLS